MPATTTLSPVAATQPPRSLRKVIAALAILILLWLGWHFIDRPAASSDLKRIFVVPPFALTERTGRTITNNDLFGRIWVSDFVYTTCPGPCPLVTASMAQLQKQVSNDPRVQLVTFTVDPKHDTPAVLAAYADKFGASKDRWWFLTGPEKQQYALIRNGFFLPVVDNRNLPPQDGQFAVTHSTQFAVVDADGVVRGYFEGTTADGRAAVLKAIHELENE